MALSELGTVLLDLLRGAGARFRARGRHGESQEGVQGLLRTMEGRRPESPYSHRSKERLRGTTLVSRQRNTFGISDEVYQVVLQSPLTINIASDCGRITGYSEVSGYERITSCLPKSM